MNKISQREARKYREELNALRRLIQDDRRTFEHSPRGGMFLMNVTISADIQATIRTARRLRHRVVVDVRDDGVMVLYGLPLPSEDVKP